MGMFCFTMKPPRAPYKDTYFLPPKLSNSYIFTALQRSIIYINVKISTAASLKLCCKNQTSCQIRMMHIYSFWWREEQKVKLFMKQPLKNVRSWSLKRCIMLIYHRNLFLRKKQTQEHQKKALERWGYKTENWHGYTVLLTMPKSLNWVRQKNNYLHLNYLKHLYILRHTLDKLHMFLYLLQQTKLIESDAALLSPPFSSMRHSAWDHA